MSTVLHYPEQETRLRKRAKKVKNVQDPKVIMTIQELKRLAHAFEAENPGIRCEGLAATQIGVSLAIAILRATDEMVPPQFIGTGVFARSHSQDESTGAVVLGGGPEYEVTKVNPAWEEFKARELLYDPWHVLINPKVIRVEDMQEVHEGCLSIPGVGCKVIRPEKVVFEYTLPNGKGSGQKLAQGFSAAAVCHEVEHLNGMLMVDNSIDTQTLSADVKGKTL